MDIEFKRLKQRVKALEERLIGMESTIAALETQIRYGKASQ